MDFIRKKKKILIAGCIFFGIMFLCTLLSKGIYGASLPQVETAVPEKRAIGHTVEAAGNITAGRELAVDAVSGLKVNQIYVDLGDSVSENTLLFDVDQEDLKEKIAEQELAIKKLEMSNEQARQQSNNEIGDVCRDFEEMRVVLKQSAEDKIKSDAEEKELIRNISHDLKTPLTAIKGYVEGLRDGIANTPEKQAKYIQTIANKVNDMDKLIDELTIYSRLDTNRVPYTFVRCNVSDYFGDCCEEIGTELEASQIELEYNDHLTEPAYMNVDPEQLKRVVNNIISNSVKYMAEGRQGKIKIDLYDEGDYIHAIFSDNGIGIAAKDVERIFERFYRTDESRNSKHGGSGIGLAIVKKIVEDHKGKIWAESVEGEGTTMHLNLLKAKDEENPENA